MVRWGIVNILKKINDFCIEIFSIMKDNSAYNDVKEYINGTV